VNPSDHAKAYLAELIGTFLLVLSIVMAVTLYVGAVSGSQVALPGISIPFVALAHGFALFIGIQSLGAVSGGHFNPAVTVGMLSIRKIAPAQAVMYLVAQFVGALLATLLLALLLHDQAQIVNFGQAKLGKDISTGSGILLEATFAFFFVWTIVAVTQRPDGAKDWAPLAIAAALALGVLMIGQWTGAALNPARAFAPDLTNALFGKEGSGGFGSVTDFLLVYLIAPLAAGTLAATLYHSIYLKKEDSGWVSHSPTQTDYTRADDEVLGPPE
jgi:aquaporin Z